MNDIIKTIGGLSLIIMVVLLIASIWVYNPIIWKLIGTDIILIIIIYVMDKATS